MLFQQFFNYGISFLVGALVIRYLGPNDYGIITYILAILSILNPILFLGSSNILPREITVKQNIDLTYSFIKFSFVIALIFFIMIFIIILFSDFDNKEEFLILSCTLLFIPFQILNYNNNAILKSKRNTISTIYTTLLIVPLKLFVVYYDLGLKWIVIIFLLDSILISVFLIWNSKINFRLIFSSKLKKLKYLNKSIIFNISATIVFILYTRIDQLMIKSFLNNFELGIYSANVKIYDAVIMIGFTISLSLLPYITKTRNNDKVIKKIYKYFYYLLLPGVILLVLFSDLVILILFGSSFVTGFISMKILLISSFFAVFTSLNNKILISCNLEKTILTRSIFALIINIILNIILIPKYGINGAAISTLVVTIFTAFIYDLIDNKSFFLNNYKFLKND